MDPQQRNEELKFIIGRYDGFFDSINNKGNIYLTVNTFILGGVIAGYTTLDSEYSFGGGMLVLFIFTLISNLVSVGCSLYSIRPYLNNKKDNPNCSAIFFRDIANCASEDLKKMWDEMDEGKWNTDLLKQVHLLSVGLDRKFWSLAVATFFIVIQIVTVVIFCLIFLKQ